MTGVAAVFAVVVAAWNPALFVERSPDAPSRRRLGWLIASGVVVGIAAATEPLLDLLSVSVPTFRTAAGTVIALVGARWLIGSAPRRDSGDQLGHGAMDIASPEILSAAMATTASDGWLLTVFAVAGALATTLGLVAAGAGGPWVPWMRRFLAAGAVVLGVALIYDGIRSV